MDKGNKWNNFKIVHRPMYDLLVFSAVDKILANRNFIKISEESGHGHGL